MLYDLSTAQQVQSIVVVFVLFVAAFVLLALWSMLVPPRSEQTSPPWGDTVWPEVSYREVADERGEEFVPHSLPVARGVAPVLRDPDPLPEREVLRYVVPALPSTNHYALPLAELVASVRGSLPPANVPVSPARHASGLVDTSDRASTTVGRHRAPVLIAA